MVYTLIRFLSMSLSLIVMRHYIFVLVNRLTTEQLVAFSPPCAASHELLL